MSACFLIANLFCQIITLFFSFQHTHPVKIDNRNRRRHFVFSDFIYNEFGNFLRLFLCLKTLISWHSRSIGLMNKYSTINENVVSEGFIA